MPLVCGTSIIGQGIPSPWRQQILYITRSGTGSNNEAFVKTISFFRKYVAYSPPNVGKASNVSVIQLVSRRQIEDS